MKEVDKGHYRLKPDCSFLRGILHFCTEPNKFHGIVGLLLACSYYSCETHQASEGDSWYLLIYKDRKGIK